VRKSLLLDHYYLWSNRLGLRLHGARLCPRLLCMERWYGYFSHCECVCVCVELLHMFHVMLSLVFLIHCVARIMAFTS